MGNEADVDRAVEAARAALDGDWGRTPPTERSRLLHALADAIQANRKELAELEVRNVGKAISSVKAELAQAVENFRFYGSAIGSIAGRANPIGGSLLYYSLKEPVGVAGQIVPWNYPLMMTTWKLAPALAAGCSIVLKPDSQTPLTALRMAELASEVGFPPGALNVVPGPGKTIGTHLVKHPGVDKIAFTGSTATGAQIMRDGSDSIKRLTLELGGKSPNLVFADADLGDAIPSSVWSIYYSAGQSCEARSRVLVESSVYDDFVSQFSEAARRLKVGDPLDPETQVGSLISTDHRDRVHGYVEARPRGGRRGRRGRRAGRGQGRLLPADRAREGGQRDEGRPGGDLRAGRHGHPVRGREGRDPDRERLPLRADVDRLDRRSRARAPARAQDQGGDGRDQHAVHGASRASRSAATSSPASAASSGSRRSSSTSRRRASSSRRARSPSIRSGYRTTLPLGRARRRHGGAGELLRGPDRAPGARAGASRAVRPVADRGRHRALERLDRADPDAVAVGPARGPGRRAHRPGERADGVRRARGGDGLGALVPDARGAARGRRRHGRKRQRCERSRGHALVPGRRARIRARRPADRDPDRRSARGAHIARRERGGRPEGVVHLHGRDLPRQRGGRRCRHPGDAGLGPRARSRGRRVDASRLPPLGHLDGKRAVPVRPDRAHRVSRPLPP